MSYVFGHSDGLGFTFSTEKQHLIQVSSVSSVSSKRERKRKREQLISGTDHALLAMPNKSEAAASAIANPTHDFLHKPVANLELI